MSVSEESHALLQLLKDMAVELGRTPTKIEFESKSRGGNYRIVRHFGSFTALVQAAGLETYDDRRSKQKVRDTVKHLLDAPIEEVIANHVPRIVESHRDGFKPMLMIGDTHFPWAHQKTLERIYRRAESGGFAYIVQMGDLQDQFSHSRFPTSRNSYRPDEEMELARKQSSEFWSELKKAAPSAECYQITGNHDVRALKSILSAAPSLETLVRDSIEKLYVFDGVTTIHDYREELVLQGVMIHHGYMSGLGKQRDFVMQDLATAHTHKMGVSYRALKDKIIAHLDVGFTGDPEAKCFSYMPQRTTGYTLGWGEWDEYGPRAIRA